MAEVLDEIKEIEIVNPFDSGIGFINNVSTIDSEDALIVWDYDEQVWKALTFTNLKQYKMAMAEKVENSLIINSSSDIRDATNVIEFDGSIKTKYVIYKPDQELNTNDNVSFGSINIPLINRNGQIDILSTGLYIQNDNFIIRKSDGTRGYVDSDLHGNADTADKVNHDINISVVRQTADSSDECTFNGSRQVDFYIYRPNQNVNIDSNVNFASVTVPKIKELEDGTIEKAFNFNGHVLGDLHGNADTADRVNHVLSIITDSSLHAHSSIEYNGSFNKVISIYEPQQLLDVSSDVVFKSLSLNTFDTVYALIKELEANNIDGNTATFAGEVVINNNLYVDKKDHLVYANISGDLYGNADTADKVNHTYTQISTDNILDTTRNVSFDGSEDSISVNYIPDQNINTYNDVEFNSIKSKNYVDADEINITFGQGTTNIGYIGHDSDGNSYAEIDTFKGELVGNSSTATKLKTPRSISITGEATGTQIFDGSENIEIEITLDEKFVTETELQETIDKFKISHIKKVSKLPEIGEEGIIYLVKKEWFGTGNGQENSNIHNEYIWEFDEIDNIKQNTGSWELIGDTAIDLSDYVTKTELRKGFTFNGPIVLNSEYLTDARGNNLVDEDGNFIKLNPTLNVEGESTFLSNALFNDNISVTNKITSDSVETNYLKSPIIESWGTSIYKEEETCTLITGESINTGNVTLNELFVLDKIQIKNKDDEESNVVITVDESNHLYADEYRILTKRDYDDLLSRILLLEEEISFLVNYKGGYTIEDIFVDEPTETLIINSDIVYVDEPNESIDFKDVVSISVGNIDYADDIYEINTSENGTIIITLIAKDIGGIPIEINLSKCKNYYTSNNTIYSEYTKDDGSVITVEMPEHISLYAIDKYGNETYVYNADDISEPYYINGKDGTVSLSIQDISIETTVEGTNSIVTFDKYNTIIDYITYNSNNSLLFRSPEDEQDKLYPTNTIEMIFNDPIYSETTIKYIQKINENEYPYIIVDEYMNVYKVSAGFKNQVTTNENENILVSSFQYPTITINDENLEYKNEE